MKLILFTFCCVFISSSCHKVEMVSGEDLSYYAYIWNRNVSKSLNDNISLYSNILEGYSILACEISWKNNDSSVAIPQMPLYHSSITSISIRVNSFSGPVKNKQGLIFKEVSKAIKRFKDSGFEINEVQLDYDCPESKLNQYCDLLKSFKEKFNIDVAITALPSWLNSDHFPKLIKNCDNYVLQLHSLIRPKNHLEIPELFVKEDAESWLYKAAFLGKHFSISLPTYGYYLGFDNNGNYLGVSSEQGPKNWPTAKVLLSDVNEIEKFIKELVSNRPALLKSVYWFRMNQDTDKLNWSFSSVKNLISGEKIEIAGVDIQCENSSPGLVDVYLINHSDFPLRVPSKFQLYLGNQNLEFYEPFKGFSMHKEKASLVIDAKDGLVLSPGEKKALCWMRFENKLVGAITYVH